MCQQNNNTKSKKGKHLEYSERQSIERWFNRDKRLSLIHIQMCIRDRYKMFVQITLVNIY